MRSWKNWRLLYNACMNTLIIHGYGNYPNESWLFWLERELGQQAWAPRLPSPHAPRMDEWMKALEERPDFLNEELVVVGHSLGVLFLLKILEVQPVKAAFFLAGFLGDLDVPFNDELQDIAGQDFDWESIHLNCPEFHVMHSDNDPYVPLEKAEALAALCRVPLELVTGAGHFNVAAGWTSAPRLLEKIRKI
jgi:predicted alpha/beta hydrolase family esterase